MSIEYSLFRMKFVRPAQTSLLDPDATPSTIFMAAIQERPSAELRAGAHWHIGNVRLFDARSGYFAIGRTTTETIATFDPLTGDFLEQELEESPYTHCVFDAEIGFIGIAKKVTISPTANGIANRVEQLLALSAAVRSLKIKVEVRPIPDPEGFLNTIAEAFRVSRFSATFGGPNPFDADEYFQRPLSVYLREAEGEHGRATISGEDLNREVLREVTRSVAATGNNASAKVQRSTREKMITINLGGDALKRRYDEEDHNPEFVLADLRIAYRQVRHDENS